MGHEPGGTGRRRKIEKRCNGMTVQVQMSAVKAPGQTTIKHDVKFNSYWD